MFGGAIVDFLNKNFFDLEKSYFCGHVHFNLDWSFFACHNLNSFDAVGGIFVYVARRGFRVYLKRYASTAFGHVATVGDKDEACFDGVDLARTHVAEDSFHGHGAYDYSATKVVVAGEYLK